VKKGVQQQHQKMSKKLNPKKESEKTQAEVEASFDQQKSSNNNNDIMGSFNAGQSHINHYLESEENNNIPEINSF
jgi:hypothetical protein